VASPNPDGQKATLIIIVLSRFLSTPSSDSQSLPPSSSFHSGTPPMRPSPSLLSPDWLYTSWKVPAASRRELLCRGPVFFALCLNGIDSCLVRASLWTCVTGCCSRTMEVRSNDALWMAIASASLGPWREVEVVSDIANELVRWFAKCSCRCYGLLVFAWFKIFRSEFSKSDEVLFLYNIVC
jgi:hypothetical protein